MDKVQTKPPFNSSTDDVPGIFTKPGHLLLLLVFIIFITEAFIMLVLDYFQPLASYQEMLLDATLLSIVTFPSLYILVFRPLRLHISRRRQAEKQKEKLIEQLQKALDEVKTLKGIIPICSSCKKIRDDKGFWQKVESYVESFSDAEFTHALCPDCIRINYPDDADEIIKRMESGEKD